jgi:hypothetical protein
MALAEFTLIIIIANTIKSTIIIFFVSITTLKILQL